MKIITNKIKSKYGTLKHYAKQRKLNYGSLRLVISNNYNIAYVKKALIKDGFLKENNNE